MNDKGFADRLDALLSEYDVDEQERILRYALDHIVPRMKGRATAEQPAEDFETRAELAEQAHVSAAEERDFLKDRLAALIHQGNQEQAKRSWLEDGESYFNTCAKCQQQFAGRKRRNVCKVCSAATAPAPVAPTEPLFLVCAGGDVYQSEIVPQSHLEDAYLLTQWCSLDGIPEDQRTDALDRFRDPDEWECVDAQVGTGRVPVEFSVDFEDGWVRVVRLPSSYAPAAPVAPSDALNEMRITLVVAVDNLCSQIENSLYAFGHDLAARHQAEGVIKHARKETDPYRYNGALRAAAVEESSTDALDAGDGTLHGAIDYWQNRALAAEAGRDADETNAVLASNYIALCARLESGSEVLTDAQIDAVTEAQWGRQPVGAMLSAHRAFARAIIAAMSAAPSTGKEDQK